MSLNYHNFKNYAKENRKNQTYSEKVIWNLLRDKRLGVKFKRQFIINNYILDFYCHELNLCIEIDGNSHEGKESYDEKRDNYLKSNNIEMLHIDSNMVVEQGNEVERIIKEWIEKRKGENPHPDPLPRGEGDKK